MRTEPTYQESINLLIMARELREAYYLHLGQVDLDQIYFVEKHGEPTKSAKDIEVQGVKSGWVKRLLEAMTPPRIYCVSVWSDIWAQLSDSKRQWLLFDALYSINPEMDGKTRAKDVVEHGVIADFAGLYWRQQDILPNMLSGESLPIKPPQLVGDDGATLSE